MTKDNNAIFGAVSGKLLPFLLLLAAMVASYFAMSGVGLHLISTTEPFASINADPKGRLFFVFLSVALIHIVVFIVMRFVHKRPYLALINPDHRPVMPDFHRAQLFLLFVFVISEFTYLALNWSQIGFMPQADFGAWWRWLVPFIIVIFLQVTAEEMFFRGYMQRFLTTLTSNPWIIILLPAIAWSLPHWGNLPQMHLKLPFTLFIFVLAVILGIISQKTGSLIFAITLHFAFNLFSTCIYGNNLRASSMLALKADFSALPLAMQSAYFGFGMMAVVIVFFAFRKQF